MISLILVLWLNLQACHAPLCVCVDEPQACHADAQPAWYLESSIIHAAMHPGNIFVMLMHSLHNT